MRSIHRPTLVVALTTLLSGCATLGQIGALQRVDFSIDGVSGVRVAGIDVGRVRSFSDLSLTDAAVLANAVRVGELPLDLDVHVQALNPSDNYTDARMVEMSWTLFIDDRETVGGRVDREIVLPRGEASVFPIEVSLDLLDFYEGGARDLYEIARSLAGAGGEPREVSLRALPVVQTPIGPISYPEPIRIVGGRIGG